MNHDITQLHRSRRSQPGLIRDREADIYYTATCRCGWSGRSLSRQDAELQHARHVAEEFGIDPAAAGLR